MTPIRSLQVLLVGVIVVPLMVLAIGGYIAWQTTRERAGAVLMQEVSVAEEHAIKVLDTHQLVGARVNDLVSLLSEAEIWDREYDVHQRLAREIRDLPQVQTVLVIGASGHPLASALTYPVNRSLVFSDRDFFRALRDLPQSNYYISAIEVGRVDGERHFIVVRRREPAPGQFAGVIAVSVSPAYFHAFYAKLVDGNPDYTAGLFRADGVSLVRHPELPPSIRAAGRGELLMRAVSLAPQTGLFGGASALDGIDRLVAYDKLENYPVYATVGRTQASIVREWLSTMLTHLYLGVPATLGLVLMSLVALRRTRREQEALASAREAVRQREAAEDALRQSQKMEAVGQLTGGVAHDFNNLLTVVIGNLGIAQRQLASWNEGAQDRLRRVITNATRGAERGATLTQRLLAFSRRQPLDPKPLDANRLIAGMSDFLRRSLGETVALETVRGAGLWQIEADPVQLEAAILNLAVNARDAMPKGGKLTIETGNAHLDADYCQPHADLVPGQYVQIAVTDTGTGMSREVLSRAFEPFFTTKQAGQGTGLGLSQVYGFVKQSGGHVKIVSEPGEGTTVRIYLPRLHAERSEEREDEAELVGADLGETILVVEDDADVRAYVVETLRELRYRVWEAQDAPSALALIERRPARIDLLLSDVVLPGMNGRQLAEEITARVPDLKVLFMTGYSHDAIVHQGRLDAGVEMIQKPFSQAQVAERIRRVLDATPV